MNQLKLFSILMPVAILSNVYCVLAGLDYLWTLFVGMGLPTITAIISGYKLLNLNDFKVLAVYQTLFIIPMTIAIEKTMLYFNTWGFSNEHVRFIGLNVFGAPIEEYLYWWLAPIMLGFIYLVMRKNAPVNDVPNFIEDAFKLIATFGNKITQDISTKDNTEYIENKTGLIKNEKGLFSIKGESKYPTWIWVQVLVIAVILWLRNYFKGSWMAVSLSTAVFVAVAFISELHAINMGFWVYNSNRMLGLFLFNIPIEEYVMYIASAISECMMLEIIGRKYFKLK